jgi:3-hydroxybutyrate dehydrogenase
MGSFGSGPTSVGREHTAPLAEATRDVWDAILAVNLTGAFHTMRRALPR